MMNNKDAIIQMLRNLKADNIESTFEFYKDIIALVDVDVEKFIFNFAKDMKISELNAYNRMEKINLQSKYRKKLKHGTLYRYEYRRDKKNIKCIFVVETKEGRRILLNAFSEDGNKKKGSKSYNTNIARAIKIYENFLKESGENG